MGTFCNMKAIFIPALICLAIPFLLGGCGKQEAPTVKPDAAKPAAKSVTPIAERTAAEQTRKTRIGSTIGQALDLKEDAERRGKEMEAMLDLDGSGASMAAAAGTKSNPVKIDATRNALTQLEEAIGSYKVKHKSFPKSLDAMVSGNVIKAIPKDAWGKVIAYDPRTGTVSSTAPDGSRITSQKK